MTRPSEIGPTRPLRTLTSVISGSSGSGPDGQVPTANGSNGVVWGSNVAILSADGVAVKGPFVNLAAGSNIVLTIDAGPLNSIPSNTIRIHATGGGSFGSNATRVSKNSSVGASTNQAREDHIHDGIGTVTASSSNTMGRGTLNLRPGGGIALNPTDTDGDGLFDTITIENTRAAGSGGGGGGSVTDYVSGASGTGQIIIPRMAGDPGIRVAGTNDDEFDTTDTSDPMTGWTTLGSPTAHNINSTAKSFYYLSSAAAALGMNGIYKACPSIPFTVTCHIAGAVTVGGNARAQLALLEAAPGKILSLGFAGNNSRPGDVICDLWTNRTTYASTQVAIGFVPTVEWFRYVVTLSTSIQAQVSTDGRIWYNFGGALNPGFTVGAIGLLGEGHTSGQTMEMLVDYIRCT